MKVFRSTLVAGVAIFAAACGDKVTVQGPTTPSTTPTVNSVTVSPSNVLMNIGQSVTFTAVVDVSNGAATTVTWSPTSGPVAVTAAGVATATAATPGVAVCATSTADANKKGCAQAVVSGNPQTIPATVSIQSITTNVGGLNAPVNPAAVTAAIDVRVNVSPGTETVTKVVVLVGAVRADSQVFTAAQSAALRFAAEESMANQSAFPPILFSINTAKFNPTTGVPTWLNGPQTISVQLYTSASATTPRATATYATALNFLNADTYVGTVATAGTTANAISSTGFRYDRGSVTVTVLPVIYTGGVVAAGTVQFGTPAGVAVGPAGALTLATGCDASGTGQRARPLVAVAGSTAWTATFPTTVTAPDVAANTVNNYEFSTALCPGANAVGEAVTVTATNTAGDAFFTAAAPTNVGTPALQIRLDNRAPAGNAGQTPPGFCGNTNNRSDNWINGAVALNASQTLAACVATTTSNNWLIDGSADVGVGVGVISATSYIRNLRIAALSGTGTVSLANAATASAAATLPAPSLAPTSYCAVVTAADALGNEQGLSANGSACGTLPGAVTGGAPLQGAAGATAGSYQFGVDIAAPTIAFDASSIAANARVSGATLGTSFVVVVSDTGSIGNSGMQSTFSVIGTVRTRTPALTTTCNLGTGAACANASANLTVPPRPTPVVINVGAAPGVASSTVATVGYVFANLIGRDVAGNETAPISRVAAHDLAGNVPSLTSALYNTPITGNTATFNANASDNFELRDIRYSIGYANGFSQGGPVTVAYAPTSLSTFPSAAAGPTAITSMVNSNVPVPVTITNFIRQAESISNADCSTQFTVAGGAFKPSSLNGFLRDVVNNVPATNPVVTAIAAADVTTGVSATTIPAAVKPFNFYISNGVTGCTSPAFAAAANAAVLVSSGAVSPAANPLSVTLNVDAYGPTATYNPTFVRVDIYADVNGTDVLELIGSATSFSTIDDGTPFGRRNRWSITWTPGTTSPVTGTAWAMGAQGLIAVGVTAAGDGLSAIMNANITLTTP
jgi:hypothetical protein